MQQLLATGVSVVAFLGELLPEALLQILGSLHFREGIKDLDGRSEAGCEGTTATASLRVIGKFPEGFGSQSAVQVLRRHLPYFHARKVPVAEGKYNAPELTGHAAHLTLSLQPLLLLRFNIRTNLC